MGATVLWPMRLLVAPSADVAREMERLPSDLTGASLHTWKSPALHSYHAPVVRAASSHTLSCKGLRKSDRTLSCFCRRGRPAEGHRRGV
jgi:hypothetical protein